MYHIKAMILAFALAIGATLSAAEDTLFFTFRNADGKVTQIEIPFPDETATEMPTMKFKNDAVEITIPATTPGEQPKIHSIGVEEIEQSTFDSTSSIRTAVAENSTVFTPLVDNKIRISAPEAIDIRDIRLYDTAGRTIACDINADGAAAVISLDAQAAGIYIINYKSHTIKVTKK